MARTKETQVEDSPATSEVKPVKTETEKTVKKQGKTFFQKALPWVIVALVFFLIGSGLVYFTLYQTTNSSLLAAKADAAQLSEKLASTEVDLQKANTSLTDAQALLTDATTSLTKSQTLVILYKFQSDVNAARASLLDQDPSSARQNLTFIADDLANLAKTGIDAESLSGLQPRIDTALQYLNSEPQKSLDALDTLYLNLSIITNNLK